MSRSLTGAGGRPHHPDPGGMGGPHCSIDGCERRVYARGWCEKHYKRWRKHGSPMGGGRQYPFPESLLRRLRLNGSCVEFTGTRSRKGYGMVWLDGRMRPAHRVMYELMVGPIPDGLVVDHLCRNHRCVNPGHLEPVTVAENQRRGVQVQLKTHCAQGHPWVPENIITTRRQRTCRLCKNAEQRRRRARARSTAA